MTRDLDDDLALLRSLVARELETINHYRTLATEAADSAARTFLMHIIEEEKIHVADVLGALAKYDTRQADLLAVGFATDHAPGEIPVEHAPEIAVDRPLERARGTTALDGRSGLGSLTVGSLRRMPQDV